MDSHQPGQQNKFYYADAAFGQNDWEPVVAFVRGLLENSEDSACFEFARKYVLRDNSLLSQTMIQQMGRMRDARGLPLIAEKLDSIGKEEHAIASPWNLSARYLETICLEAAASIGGPSARQMIQAYRNNSLKSYLQTDLKNLTIAAEPCQAPAPYPDEYPEELKGIRSYLDVISEGGFSSEYDSAEIAALQQKLQSVKFPGIIEYLSGDGRTTTFPLKHKITDHIHNFADPFTDFGIYLSNPKIEYPPGRRRWAISHTFLWFQVPDGDLYGKEYTWDVDNNTITTHFHEHVSLEKVDINSDRQSVTVPRTPISTGVELRGNMFSTQCTSAVRGVWDNPEKKGRNYYVRRAHILTPYRGIYYFRPYHTPVVQQYGIWMVEEEERPEQFFDTDGECVDVAGVIEHLRIPLHEPKVLSDVDKVPYETVCPNDPIFVRIHPRIKIDLSQVPSPDILQPYLGAQFQHSRCGQAGWQTGSDNGYQNGLDINSDGVIDVHDQNILAQHAGEVYRMNVGNWGYFGGNWISTGNEARSKNFRNEKAIFICSYDYGAGYDPATGKINLFESPPASVNKMYVEYFYDTPPVEGNNNLKIYLHPKL